jgi:hypothetical protein
MDRNGHPHWTNIWPHLQEALPSGSLWLYQLWERESSTEGPPDRDPAKGTQPLVGDCTGPEDDGVHKAAELRSHI